MLAQVAQRPIDWCTKLEQTTEVITQVAIRILFIASSVWMAMAMLPVSMHAVVVPVIGFSATVLSGFFFPQPFHIQPPDFGQLPPLVRPVKVAEPVEAPAQNPHLPRGLLNSGNNCCFNSISHLINSDPSLSAWIRRPLTEEIEWEPFRDLLIEYNAPAPLVEAFLNYVNEMPHPRLSLPRAFEAFRWEENPNLLKDLQLTLSKLCVSPDYAAFFNAYDLGEEVDSHNLRGALVQVQNSIQRGHVQEDAAEILDAILSSAPPKTKMEIQVTYRYADRETRQNEPQSFITLEITPDDRAPHLGRMFETYQRHAGIERNGDGSQALECTRTFTAVPPALRFQIKRYRGYPPGASSLLSKYWPQSFPQLPWTARKVETPIEIPEELAIQVNGEERRYRLSSFVEHLGTTTRSGHYTACRSMDGQKYLFNDAHVTPVDQAQWNAHLRGAYLLCYLPVPR
jgi:hypothetical protein